MIPSEWSQHDMMSTSVRGRPLRIWEDEEMEQDNEFDDTIVRRRRRSRRMRRRTRLRTSRRR